jgi:hypothetical protein
VDFARRNIRKIASVDAKVTVFLGQIQEPPSEVRGL